MPKNNKAATTGKKKAPEADVEVAPRGEVYAAFLAAEVRPLVNVAMAELETALELRSDGRVARPYDAKQWLASYFERSQLAAENRKIREDICDLRQTLADLTRDDHLVEST